MKLENFKSINSGRPTVEQAGYTLVEVMFVSTIMVFVVGALISAHIMGLRMNQLVQSKCGASDSSRKVLQQLPTDIRSAKMWNIGNVTQTNNPGSSFVAITNGANRGNALKLCNTTNGSEYTIYYFDLSDTNNSNGRLVKTSVSTGSSTILCSNLINSLYFTAEDYNGMVQTNFAVGRSYKNVIHVILQFCQFQYPKTIVGTNGLYDYYKMEFKITPHLPE